MKKYILGAVIAFCGLSVFFSCSEEELGPSIFPIDEEEELDPTSYTYAFDKFLLEEYLKVYNLDFRYKMQDVGADMNYNLVPASYQNAKEMAVLVKYLWFDVYKEVVGPDFLKINGPRIIHLIGSAAFNPTSGTKLLGLAEGGKKISLFQVNELDFTDLDFMNEQFFKTMHHEFAHILHQKKTYPAEYNTISASRYDPFGWQERNDSAVLSLGFISDYASSQAREDFVEVIANYIVKSEADWNAMMSTAAKGWVKTGTSGGKDLCEEGADLDNVDGPAVLKQKFDICNKWLRDAWEIELQELHDEVQRRQNALDKRSPLYNPNLMDSLLNEIETYKVAPESN